MGNNVTFEIAKLAKEMGFGLPTNDYFIDKHETLIKGTTSDMNKADWSISAPKLLELKEWVEENTGVKIIPEYNETTYDYQCILYCKEGYRMVRYVVSSSKQSETYNDALMSGIKEGLMYMKNNPKETNNSEMLTPHKLDWGLIAKTLERSGILLRVNPDKWELDGKIIILDTKFKFTTRAVEEDLLLWLKHNPDFDGKLEDEAVSRLINIYEPLAKIGIPKI